MNDPALHPLQLTEPEDEIFFQSLRVSAWKDFMGQTTIKTSLQIAISAARQRKEVMDHTLFYGPPGLGKTTLSNLISKELGVNLKMTSGTAITKPGDVAALLTNLKPGDVLFIDEVHRLPKIVEETLYPVMEDFALDIMIGKGPSARTVRLDVPRFTLVAATTRFGMLAGPFRDRFGLIHRLEYYTPAELSVIIQTAAEKLKVKIKPDASVTLGERSRGTPRIALKLLKRVRDYTQMKNLPEITVEAVKAATKMYEIDEFGLDNIDRLFLNKIITQYKGGPVGISTIAASMNEDTGTIEEVIEPYLLQIGFLQRTPRGRTVTDKARNHLTL